MLLISEKKESTGKGDTSVCEACGKVDLTSRFKKSNKRFCSTACAKR